VTIRLGCESGMMLRERWYIDGIPEQERNSLTLASRNGTWESLQSLTSASDERLNVSLRRWTPGFGQGIQAPDC